MKSPFTEISGSIVAPKGFLTGSVFCDIKRLGTGKGSEKGKKRDLAVIVSELPCIVAGLFTTNQVCAAPVKVCIENLARSKAQARAIVVNSGNANACTGAVGLKNAKEMAAITALQLERSANGSVNPSQIHVASTGRIGVPLPMPNVRAGIRAAMQNLGRTEAHASETSEAIMTSDTQPKSVAVEFRLSGKQVRIGGICKGAGMIQPGMSPSGRRPASMAQGLHATMLSFLTSDVAIQPIALQKALTEAVALSFNRITVDGDMSTNDTVLILANGQAGNPVLGPNVAALRRDLGEFQAALNHICLSLARKIVRDGEGVTRFVTVRVDGARTALEADAAARAVANSSLVKTSWNGGDPNWGRIIDALGYSPALVQEQKVDIGYSRPAHRTILWSLKKGQPTRTPFAKLWELVQHKEFDLHIRLNLGRGNAIIYAADLSEEYVDFNRGAIADPRKVGELGG